MMGKTVHKHKFLDKNSDRFVSITSESYSDYSYNYARLHANDTVLTMIFDTGTEAERNSSKKELNAIIDMLQELHDIIEEVDINE